MRTICATLLLSAFGACSSTRSEPLKSAEPPRPTTTAERSDYARTSTSDDVARFVDTCVAAAPEVLRRVVVGKTVEGRDLVVVLAADPPVADVASARADGRPVVFVLANIHAGEVEGKEASQQILREVAFDGLHRELLSSTIVAFLPNYNADGNDKIDRRNRPDQAGPIEGVGRRPNAAGLDLNRDFVKAVAPETRALLKATRDLDALLVIDCHATNGSFHGYDLTYAGPLHPATDAGLLAYTRETFLPRVRAAMRAKGFETFDYGNWVDPNDPRKGWESFEAKPRFSNSYFGLRNRFTLLSEAYSHDPFEKRVASTKALVLSALRIFADEASTMRAIARAADASAADGSRPRRWPLRGVLAQTGFEDVPVGSVREEKDAVTGLVRQWDSDEATPTRMPVYAHFDGEDFRPVPEGGWAIDEPSAELLALLSSHGVAYRTFEAPTTLSARVFHTTEKRISPVPFQNLRVVSLRGGDVFQEIALGRGAIFVPARQPAARLAFILLEPTSEDGLGAWEILKTRTTPDDREFFVVSRLEHDPFASNLRR